MTKKKQKGTKHKMPNRTLNAIKWWWVWRSIVQAYTYFVACATTYTVYFMPS